MIAFFACQDLASCIKISQITSFSCVFSGKKALAHGESETTILPLHACEPRFHLNIVV
jgi:hypothetical protein